MLRPKLLPLVTWQLGDGRTCTVFAQPWFENATVMAPQLRSDSRLRVCDLLDGSGSWNIEEIVRLVGYQTCMSILSTVRPPTQAGTQDRLIFSIS